MPVAVIFGGPSPEHDVSVLTGLQAVRALGDAAALYWSKSGEFFDVTNTGTEGSDFVDGVPPRSLPLRLVAGPGGGFVGAKSGALGKERRIELDAAMNCCHGGPGEDGTLQGILDSAGVRYTGPTLAGAALGMDKLAFGAAIAAAGLPSLPRVALTDNIRVDFEGPYIVKPRFGGSSIGIETVADLDTAKALLGSVHLRRGAVIEPYRADAIDLNVAIRTYPEAQLSPIEKPLRTQSAGEILDYNDKYVGGEGMASAPRELPAQIPDALADRIRDMANQATALAMVRGVARLDFLLDGDALYVNEINTIPGSLSKYLWEAGGVGFRQLLDDMLAEAGKRPTTEYVTAGADGAALRSAGTIASKLG